MGIARVEDGLLVRSEFEKHAAVLSRDKLWWCLFVELAVYPSSLECDERSESAAAERKCCDATQRTCTMGRTACF